MNKTFYDIIASTPAVKYELEKNAGVITSAARPFAKKLLGKGMRWFGRNWGKTILTGLTGAAVYGGGKRGWQRNMGTLPPGEGGGM